MASPLHTADGYPYTVPNSPFITSTPASRHYYVFPNIVHHTMVADHFAVAGLTLRNNLPRYLCQTHSLTKFISSLKSPLLSRIVKYHYDLFIHILLIMLNCAYCLIHVHLLHIFMYCNIYLFIIMLHFLSSVQRIENNYVFCTL